jgi:nicotinamide-nucleotide amidase
MPSAEIITIGTEILLGEIVDTNAQFLAQALRDAGIDLFRTTSVGDNVKRIAQAIRDSLERCDIVITTGGLGPTVDDPTRDAVAAALGVRSIFRPELWDQIQARFQRLGRFPTENNKRQAYTPEGAVAIENPVGTAPIFVIQLPTHVVISLPGVPSEMKYLVRHNIIPYLRQFYDLQSIIKTRILHTVGIGESQIDDLIGDLERLTNPTVGLAAHSGQVDLRITAKAASETEALALIQPVEDALRNQLGDWIYGTDQETLEEIALQSISANNWCLAVVEAGLGGNLIRRLVTTKGCFAGGQVLAEVPDIEQLASLTNAYRHFRNADVALGVTVQKIGDAFDVHQILISPHETSQFTRRYGGPPEYAPLWAFNQSMDLIRRISHDS